MKRSIEELQAELRAAEQAERERLREAAKLVHPVYKYTLKSVESDRWHPLFDPTAALFRLRSEATNEDELRAVGKVPFQGSMTYVFSFATGKFICSVGGGTITTTSQADFDRLAELVMSVSRLQPNTLETDSEIDVTHLIKRDND